MLSDGFLRFAFLCMAVAAPLTSIAQFQAIPKVELSMTSDPDAPGASAVYLYREETTEDPHAFRTVYARIKILTADGKSAAVVHIDFPKTFVFNALGSNSSRMTGGFSGSVQGSAVTNSAHWAPPSMTHVGEDSPWDTESYVGKGRDRRFGRQSHPSRWNCGAPYRQADRIAENHAGCSRE